MSKKEVSAVYSSFTLMLHFESIQYALLKEKFMFLFSVVQGLTKRLSAKAKGLSDKKKSQVKESTNKLAELIV